MNKHDDWKTKSANIITGCSHDCLYCYSKEMAVRYGWVKQEDWPNERFRQHSFDANIKNSDRIVQYPTSHDITPIHLDKSIEFLQKILDAGNEVMIVSKPHLECIKKICKKFDQYKNKILFRFTIGSTDDKVLKFWEPGAPCFKERLNCLKYAFNKGYQTSVSCEPMLDNHIDKVVGKVDPFVTETIWIGKANRLLGTTGRGRLVFNGNLTPESMQKALQLIEWQSDENLIKLYESLKNNKKIRWKTSISSVLQKHSLPV